MNLTATAKGLAALVVPTLAMEAAFGFEHASILMRTTFQPSLGQGLIAAAGVWALLVLALGLGTVVQARRWARGTRGRVRLLVSGIAAPLNVLATAGAVAILTSSESAPLLRNGIALGIAPDRMLPLAITASVAAAAMVAWLGTSVATWFLLPALTRARLWRVIDVLVLFAGVAVLALLPAQPTSSASGALRLPVLRHVVTTLAVLRLGVRGLPWLLDAVESLSYQTLIASRHLRAKKSGFLAAISILAILAVTVSSCALATTLSVMGGFRNDLKRKILGNNAHVVVDRDNKTIEDWEPMLETARSTADVSGASPYVGGEVMLSSASNLATAVLRGIDPAHISEVSDLQKNIRSGKLEYLVAPEKLRDLPPDMMGKMLLPIADGAFAAGQANGDDLVAAPKPTEKPSTAPEANVPADAGPTTADPAPATDPAVVAPNKNAPTKVADALSEFLLDDKATGLAAPAKRETRETLPGIIIGQELARSLRLYLGDEVNVVAPLGALGPAGPMPKSRPFRVAGIFYSGMYEYDMKYTYVTLPTAQRFLNTGDAIHGIEIKTSDTERAPQVAELLRTTLKDRGVRVRDWQALNSRLFGALAVEKLVMFILLGIAILVASFCIAATLMLMVQEKGRQIAVLKAIGSPDRAIVTVFVLEGLMIGAGGATLGLFLGYMMCFAFEHFGVRMNPEVYYIDKLPVHIEPSEFILVGIASVLVCLLVTIYPAILGSRLRPVDALRYE